MESLLLRLVCMLRGLKSHRDLATADTLFLGQRLAERLVSLFCIQPPIETKLLDISITICSPSALQTGPYFLHESSPTIASTDPLHDSPQESSRRLSLTILSTNTLQSSASVSVSTNPLHDHTPTASSRPPSPYQHAPEHKQGDTGDLGEVKA